MKQDFCHLTITLSGNQTVIKQPTGQLSTIRDKVTAEEVKVVLLGMAYGQETLLACFRVHNENFDKRVGVNRKAGSAKAYWNALNHLTKFVNESYKLSDIPFTNWGFIEITM